MKFVIEEGRWLVAEVPQPGRADLLARQAYFHMPVKAIAPDVWRAEAPFCEGAEAILEAAVASVLSEVPPEDAAREPLPAAHFASLAWVECPAGLALRLESAGANHVITASAESGAVFFRTTMLRRRIPESVRDVMAHFLFALNARLRLARASWSADGIVLEVIFPAATLDSFLVEEAAQALGAGFRLARRECACLLDGRVAQQYREFHFSKGEER